MSMEQDFLMLLRRTPAVYELTGTRIAIDRRPQKGNEPAIVVSRISGGHDHTLTASGGWAQPVMHVICFADKEDKANHLRDAVRNALQSFTGVVGNTKFDSMILDDEDHDYLEPIDASDSGTFARLLVFRVMHSERIPTFS